MRKYQKVHVWMLFVFYCRDFTAFHTFIVPTQFWEKCPPHRWCHSRNGHFVTNRHISVCGQKQCHYAYKLHEQTKDTWTIKFSRQFSWLWQRQIISVKKEDLYDACSWQFQIFQVYSHFVCNNNFKSCPGPKRDTQAILFYTSLPYDFIPGFLRYKFKSWKSILLASAQCWEADQPSSQT